MIWVFILALSHRYAVKAHRNTQDMSPDEWFSTGSAILALMVIGYKAISWVASWVP